MFFEIIERRQLGLVLSQNVVILEWDDWNDYSYFTLFGIYYIDENKTVTDLGGVKIGFYGQKPHDRVLNTGLSFDEIGDEFFSLGVDAEYYIKLNSLGEEIRDKILFGLHDIAKDNNKYLSAINEEVIRFSFLRFISITTIIGQYRRLANGGLVSTNYNIEITTTFENSLLVPLNLILAVAPDSYPTTNIHVIIGRNGVGKSKLFNTITKITQNPRTEKYGKFVIWEGDQVVYFANLISISFSAFDEFITTVDRDSSPMPYIYIGLKIFNDDDGTFSHKSNNELLREFLTGFINCLKNSKSYLLELAFDILESDPIFSEQNISNLLGEVDWIDNSPIEIYVNTLSNIFQNLSSGHKLILLTIVKLVESIQERSLILIDEPESHLHPPLLSSFIRALSKLLEKRNAVSIISTHSPVVLQEVPKSCVWKLRRSGSQTIAERLGIESFGENVGVLTHEVFGLEVTESGFHKLLLEIINTYNTYEQAVESLGNQLGMEGKSILRSLYALKNH